MSSILNKLKDYYLEHKEVCIIILICIVTLIALIICICIALTPKKEDIALVKFMQITSRDNLYTLSLPTTIDYTVGNDSDSLSLDLYDNKKEIYIYGNTIEKSREIDLYDVINDDKNSYFSSKQNVTEIKAIHEFKVNNYFGYEYSVSYLDNENGKEFYCNVVWIQTDNYIFILNFEVPTEKSEEFKSTFEEIKNSFNLTQQ